MNDISNISFNPHPASIIPFDVLYPELQKRVESGYISRQKNDDLELYNYTNTTTFEKYWDVYTISSRGIILSLSQKKIISYCLPKFFNYQEYPNIPNLPFSILDKLDGSCIMIWFFNGKWNCSTRGSFFSDQALWAKNYFDNNINHEKLVKGYTYIAEVIYPQNRIVINYDFSGLVLLTAYDNMGYELNNVNEMTKDVGFLYPKVFNYSSITELLNVAQVHVENKEVSEEGFVVKFANGFRTKIKYADYITLHKLIANCTPLLIWESMRDMVDIEEMKRTLPEEFRDDIDLMTGIFNGHYNKMMSELKTFCEENKQLSDKELGILIQTSKEFIPYIAKKFAFGVRKNKFYDDMKKPSRIRNSFFDCFRPTGNVLEGYTPNKMVNRALQEEG